MGFKFLKQEQIPDQPETVEGAYERFHELVNNQLINEQNQLRLTTDNRPAVFLNISRHRDTISNDEWLHILRQQRIQLMEYMWDSGMIMNTIISQDEYGFTLRTEINF